ncbi:MAG: hypothetical protein ACYC5M_14905 [Anaerolineae bacterium]
MAGWGLGVAFQVHEALVGVLFAFLSGGIILNILKEELPDERASSFGAFSLGALIYAALLLLALPRT